MTIVPSNSDQIRLPWIRSDEDESWISHRALELRFPRPLPGDDAGLAQSQEAEPRKDQMTTADKFLRASLWSDEATSTIN